MAVYRIGLKGDDRNVQLWTSETATAAAANQRQLNNLYTVQPDRITT
jgi:hypothetical protein